MFLLWSLPEFYWWEARWGNMNLSFETSMQNLKIEKNIIADFKSFKIY